MALIDDRNKAITEVTIAMQKTLRDLAPSVAKKYGLTVRGTYRGALIRTLISLYPRVYADDRQQQMLVSAITTLLTGAAEIAELPDARADDRDEFSL